MLGTLHAWWVVVLMMTCTVFSDAVHAGSLDADDVHLLRSDIETMTAAFERGDAELLIARTHPSLKALSGGPDAFAELTRYALKQLGDLGISFVSRSVGTPTDLYPAGEEEVCFVPRVSVMALGGRQMTSTTFMIAIRRKGDGTWTCLEGAGLRNNPGMLHRLLPALDQNIALPPNTLE